MEQLIRRVDRAEERLDQVDARHYAAKDNFNERFLIMEREISSLKAFRDNTIAKHSSAPAWLFGSISAAVSIAALLFNLYLAGIKAP